MKDIADPAQKVLDIGCGINKVPGTTGMDIDPDSHCEIIHDLNVYPYPVEDNTFDKVYAKHIIEHLDDPQSFLLEIYRMLKPGGTAWLATPHFSSYTAYAEPQHKFFYSYFLFRNLLSHTKFITVEHRITFYKSFRFWGIQSLANRDPETYERFWTYMFPAENVTLLVKKPE